MLGLHFCWPCCISVFLQLSDMQNAFQIGWTESLKKLLFFKCYQSKQCQIQQKCLSSGLLLSILWWQTDSLSGLCVNTGAITGGIGFVDVCMFRYMCASQGEGSMGFYIWNGKLADSNPPRKTFPLFKS